MKNFQEKRKFRQIMQSRPILIILAIMVLVFAWSVLGLVGRMQETVKNKKVAEQKLQELQKEKENLLSDINKLNTNEGLEASIREKWDYGKDGEGMVMVVDDKNAQQTDAENKSSGFLSFFKNWFK